MKIYFLNGSMAGETFEVLAPGISVGREDDNDLQLLVGGVSRYHVKFEKRGDEWYLKDLGSTNGTKLNGEVVSRDVALSGGEIITIGDQTVRFGEKQVSAPIVSMDDSSQDRKTVSEVVASQSDQNVRDMLADVRDIVSDEKSNNVKNFFDSFKTSMTTAFSRSQADGDNGDKAKRETKLFDQLNFFSSRDGNSQKSNSTAPGNAPGPRRLSNMVFYVSVIGATIIFVSIFIAMQRRPTEVVDLKQEKQSKREFPFLFIYEKQETTVDNIFNFRVSIENGVVSFTLDDLKTGRHYALEDKLKKGALEDLKESIKSTSFMELKDFGESPIDSDLKKVMIIAMDGKLNEIVVRDEHGPTSFEQIETAIDDFSDIYGLRTIARTVEEMKEDAVLAFNKAEQLFKNYKSRPENLTEAIKRYDITMECLKQFAPRPKMWDDARKSRSEAEKIRNGIIRELEREVSRLYNLESYGEAIVKCQLIMDMLSPTHKAFNRMRKNKLKLEKLHRSLGRK